MRWWLFERKASGNVVVVEIDECSIEFSAREGKAAGRGAGPVTPIRRRIDRAGVRAVAFDVLFIDRCRSSSTATGFLMRLQRAALAIRLRIFPTPFRL